MTALASLIQHCEAPWEVRLPSGTRYSSFMEAEAAFWSEWAPIRESRAHMQFLFNTYAVAQKVQAQQRASGIPVETIQEAIDRGVYSRETSQNVQDDQEKAQTHKGQ